jgi:hypothetical protein
MSSVARLLETIKSIHTKRGDSELTPSDKQAIDAETADLITKSVRNKQAVELPKEFEEIYNIVKDSKDSQDAFDKLVALLKDRGDIEEEVKEDKEDKKEEKSEDKSDEKSDESESIEEKMEDKKAESDSKEDKKEEDKDEKPKKEDSKKEDKEESKDDKKAKVLAQAGELFKDDKPIVAPKGPKGPKEECPVECKDDEVKDKKKRLMDLQDEPKKDTKSIENLGMEAKISVRILKSGNIMVSDSDLGPLFLVNVPKKVKASKSKLVQLATKIKNTIDEHGVQTAATKCGSKLIAGLDENIKTNYGEMEENKDKVTDNAETETEEGPPKPGEAIHKDKENDTEKKPLKPSTGLEDVSGDAYTQGAEDDVKDSPKDESGSLIEDTEVDFKTSGNKDINIDSIDNNYKRLYANKLEKEATDRNNAFVDKFMKCVKIASTRMKLNYHDHPFKAAYVDTLCDDEFTFMNGDRFNPMDVQAAFEIAEQASMNSHDEFVEHLLSHTADLMERSDDYLDDVSSDLESMTPVVDNFTENMDTRTSSVTKIKPNSMREAVKNGNFNLDIPSSEKTWKAASVDGNIKDAVTVTSLGRRVARVKSV